MAASVVFITGVSSGIGHALAEIYLRRGCKVLGISRRVPQDLISYPAFTFAPSDIANHADTKRVIKAMFKDIAQLDLALLNAGILGPFGDMREVSLEKMQHVMNVNAWANKVLLDALTLNVREIRQVVAISSGASRSGTRGFSGYAISKAALNMLVKLYAREFPNTHFCALAPGIVDTAMQVELCARPEDERFPVLDRFKSSRGTPEMPSAGEVAKRLIDAFARIPKLVESGEFTHLGRLIPARNGPEMQENAE